MMNLETFLAEFPAASETDTGGGCSAIHANFPGGYMLLTSDCGGDLPDAADTCALVGEYDSDGEVTRQEFMPIARAAARLRELEPAEGSVAHYFRQQLGCMPECDTCSGPLDSECGRDCKAAIDAAAELLRHVRAAGGSRANRIGQRHIIKAVDEAIAIYICG